MVEEEGSEKSSQESKASTETAMAVVSAPTVSVSSAPSWFTPKRLLIIFCVINLLNYVDRGVIASNGVNGSRGSCTANGICSAGTGIQGVFNLNNFEDGVISSAFMVGLLISSPIFALLAKSHNPFRLIGVGLSIWTIAVVGCGFSFNFWSISACRMLVGVGEASFISLAAPFIDDNAPVAQKTAWLAIFYMCIPSGFALGYVYGGLVGDHTSWRYAFFGEAIFMLPFAILGFILKPLQMKGFASVDSGKVLTAGQSVETTASQVQDSDVSNGKESAFSGEELRQKSLDETTKLTVTRKICNQFVSFGKDLKLLLSNKVYLINVLGYVAYTFVMGAYSYWGPKAGYSVYHMTNADMLFGGVTIVCGILGTLAGGIILDYISNSISNGFKLLSVTTLLGAALCFGAFCFKNMYAFLVVFAFGELLIFAAQAPVNFISLHCVAPNLRPLSMAISTVSIHIFGDVPSSPLVGLVQDNLNNWRKTSLILTSILFPAAVIWFIGVFFKSVDRFNEDAENQLAATTRDRSNNTTPLLEGEAEKTHPSPAT